jgi:hypothetical protein
MKEHDFEIGDIVKYSWSTEDRGVVLKIACPYKEQPDNLYLYVLWAKGETKSKKWWVPIDKWVVKL